MKHAQSKTPAHNCGPRGANCQHKIKGDHGIHNEEWRYVVVTDDGRAALSLRVGSGIYTADTPPVSWGDKPNGYSIDLHLAFPTDREDVKAGAPRSTCSDLPGGLCTCPYSGALAADEFVQAHFDKAAGYEQPARFWTALEARLADLLTKYHDASAEWARCPHCDGSGTVTR